MSSVFSTLFFDCYLRLNRASQAEWLAGLKDVFECEELSSFVAEDSADVGSLSSLAVEQGNVACLSANQNLEINGCLSRCFSLIFPLQGDTELTRPGFDWQSIRPVVAIPGGASFSLRMTEGDSFGYIGLKPSASFDQAALLSDSDRSELRRVIEGYFDQARFFLDCEQAKVLTQNFLQALARSVGNGWATVVSDPVTLDRRLVRMIEKIESDPEWDFDLKDLASYVGASERNLYYLMKRETGFTPYRFFQRSRLLRVRRRLVDCQCEMPNISRYASDEGFSHLGRFSALYRSHFGELPSETIQKRRQLTHPGA